MTDRFTSLDSPKQAAAQAHLTLANAVNVLQTPGALALAGRARRQTRSRES